MSTKTLRTMAVAVVLALSAPFGAFAAGHDGQGTPAFAPYTAPRAEEAIDLNYMRGEEKFSRDLYLGFAEFWDIAPFALVANAEQRHMDAVLRALRRYGLPDPVAGTLAGEFRDVELQALYAALLEKGLANPLDALRVGGLVEEVDLLDLEYSAMRTTNADIARLYENLACGARNHLRAFAEGIRTLAGQAYVAQSMSQEAVDAILQQPRQRCGRP